jgi:hypothetical protein
MFKGQLKSALGLYLTAFGILTGWQPTATVFAQVTETPRRLLPPSSVQAALVAALAEQQAEAAKTPDPSELKIVVLEGEDGVNIIKKKTAVKPVVEVRDKNNLPVTGAAVTFSLPQVGAGGAFANGSKLVTILTDSTGRAAVASMHPIGTGAFKITVTAALHGHVATAVIAQTNYLTLAAAHAAAAAGASAGTTGGAGAGGAGAGGAAAGGLSGAAIGGIVAGVAAAAVVAAKVATGGKKSTTTSTPITPTGTIGVGSGPVFGSPH